MRHAPLRLLIALPGWSWAYITHLPHRARQATAPAKDVASPLPVTNPGNAMSPAPRFPVDRPRATHAERCRPLFRKGFSKGGMGKQGELMEMMAKAKQERLKKELEEKLKESGDLPQERDEGEKPLPASRSGRIKPERSWREAGAADAATSDTPDEEASASAPALPSAPPAMRAPAPAVRSRAGATDGGSRRRGADGKRRATPAGTGRAGEGGKVWPSLREGGRSGSMYDEYESLLEDTGDPADSRMSPELEDPRASFAQYEALKEKAELEAIRAGKPSVANRSPLASETDYDEFEAMLVDGTGSSSVSLGHKAEETKIMKRIDKQVPQSFASGDFAPLDPWRALSDTEGAKVNFGLFQGTKPLLVVADPSPASGQMRQSMHELNNRMPRKLVDVVAITPDSSGNNRKIAKKSRISFPVLSDDSGEWMKAYRLTAVGQQEKMAFLIEPELGQIVNVWSNFDAISLVDLVKEYHESK